MAPKRALPRLRCAAGALTAALLLAAPVAAQNADDPEQAGGETPMDSPAAVVPAALPAPPADPLTDPAPDPAPDAEAPVTETTTSVDAPPPNDRWTLRGVGFITAGPFKATGLLGVHYRHIYQRDDNILFDKLNVSTGFDAYLNPSTPGVQLWFEWQPLAILKLKVSYDAIATTGLAMGLGYGLSFPSADSPFDGDTLKARQGEEQLGLGHRLAIKPTVQAKVGPVVLINELEIGAWFVHGPSGEWWYDILYDTLIRRGEIDGILANRTILAAEAWAGSGDERLLIGAVNQVTHSFGSEIERDRLGGFIAFTPTENIWGIARPTLLVMPGVTLVDPNRQYEFWLEAAIVLSWDFREE